MPANAIIENANSVDNTAVSIIAIIGNAPDIHNVVEQIRLQDGDAPSFALCKVPLKDLDSIAPAVAAVESSPRAKIKHGTPAYVVAIVGGTSLVLMSGIVTAVSDQWSASEDCLIVRIEDERERMRKFPIIGSFWAQGAYDSSDGVAYRQGWAFHTNPGGAPNCIWRKAAGWKNSVPVMCNPWHGITENSGPPLPSAGDYEMACYWTPRTIMQYLEFAVSSAGLAIAAYSGFTEFPVLPSSIVWPQGLGDGLTVRGVSLDTIGQDRKADDRNYERMTLLGALQHVASMAGPYSINLTYGAEADDDGLVKSSLQVVRTRYDGAGLALTRPSSGTADPDLKGINVVLAGSLNESSANLYSKYVAAGDLVFIERRVRMTYDGDNDSGELRRAWDSTTQDAFKALVQTTYNAGGTLSAAIQKAVAKYPSVGAAYRLQHDYDFQAGTSQATRGLANLGRPILQTMLSNYLENQSGDSVADQTKRWRRPILFEYQSKAADPDAGTWVLCPVNDGLTLDSDGTIWVQGLQPGYTLAISASGTVPNATITLNANKLRASVAIPCDHRLTAARKLATDSGDMPDILTPSRDESRIEKDLEFLLYEGQGDGDYALEERYQSWPVPGAVSGSSAATGVLRTDATMLANHAERRASDFGRLEKSGELIMRNPLTPLRPGTQIESLSNSDGTFPLNCVVRAVEIRSTNQSGSGAVGVPAQHVIVEVV